HNHVCKMIYAQDQFLPYNKHCLNIKRTLKNTISRVERFNQKQCWQTSKSGQIFCFKMPK
ncbi:MAG: hypothetical protein ACR2PH_17640, partial [Desulfobulbia bacterium]